MLDTAFKLRYTSVLLLHQEGTLCRAGDQKKLPAYAQTVWIDFALDPARLNDEIIILL